MKIKIKTIKEIADYFFALYIRQRDNFTCVICGSKIKPQCGHLFSRQYINTRYDESNAFCQCATCNILHKYNQYPYFKFFLEKFSKNKLDNLYKSAIIKSKWDINFYLGKALYYYNKCEKINNDRLSFFERRLKKYDKQIKDGRYERIPKKVSVKKQNKREDKKGNLVCRKRDKKAGKC